MAQIPSIHWAEVIMALHPTPAIGGSPKTMASTMITRLEATTRGWYGGLFGVSIDTTIDLAVTIRGVVVTDDACVTHVGAGIVAASDPAQEWEELNRKQHSILSVLGHTNTEFFS
jgi:menaquinone-specific isochorismate synthase